MIRTVAVCGLFLSVSVAVAETPVNYPRPISNKPTEPLAAKLALAKTAAFLDGVAVNWTRDRNCGTCHTNYPYVLARPLLKDALHEGQAPACDEVRAYFERRVANWDRGEKGDAPRWPAEVVATAATLAIADAYTGKMHPRTRQALDRMWTVQKPDGGFNWLKCDWPPLEHDDYYGVVYAAIGVGMAPEGYAQTDKARAGLDKIRAWLKKNAAPDLHHKAQLLWAATRIEGLLTNAEKAETIKALRQLQRPDRGWSLASLGAWKRRDGTPNDPKDASDGYATGLVVFVLRQAGVPTKDDQIYQGIKWLQTHQRESGRWFTRSLSTDSHHFITNAGTSYAVLALYACGALRP
jgi:squalene-hopene/tetraprenyl-beta-curcumene cyclase